MATETLGSGNTIFIDLGLDRGEPETYRAPTRSTVPGWFRPMLVAVLLLITAGASAAPPRPVLTGLLTLPMQPGDSYTTTDAGQLLTQTGGALNAYGLADGTRTWAASTPAPTYRLRTSDGVVLLRPWAIGPGQPTTTAVDLRTGTARWSHHGTVVTLPGSPALISVNYVLSIASSSRRVQGPVESLDPATGRVLWHVDVPSTAVLTSVPGPAGRPPRMLLVYDNRTMAVYDTGTGRKLTEGPLPPADYGPENPAVSGGLLVLRHQVDWGWEFSAYDPVTLELKWRRPADGQYDPVDCGPLACLAGADGVRALDPTNGAIVWYRPDWHSLAVQNGRLFAYTAPDAIADPVGVIDPATGRVLLDLHGWRVLNGSTGTGDLLVTRVADGGARTITAIARPGDTQPRMLTDLPAGTGECQTAPGRLICRNAAGELHVWAYREKG